MWLYHLAPRAQWDANCSDGLYRPASLQTEGFIHFSTSGQLRNTLARFFPATKDLVLAAVDPEALGPELRWEAAEAQELFPHLYRSLRLTELCDLQHIGDGREYR